MRSSSLAPQLPHPPGCFLYIEGRRHYHHGWRDIRRGGILDLNAIFLVIILWAHALAAVTWVGGSIFYAVAIYPAMEDVGPSPDRLSFLAAIGREFGEMVRLAILVFVVTGGILIFTRLSAPRVSAGYVAVLVLKILLAFVMFWLAGRLRKRPAAREADAPPRKPTIWWRRIPYLILWLGLTVYLLSLVLRVLFEQTLGPPLS